MKIKNKIYMTHHELADMHSDGVYFNEELLAQKRKKVLQKKKVKLNTSKI